SRFLTICLLDFRAARRVWRSPTDVVGCGPRTGAARISTAGPRQGRGAGPPPPTPAGKKENAMRIRPTRSSTRPAHRADPLERVERAAERGRRGAEALAQTAAPYAERAAEAVREAAPQFERT